MTYRHTRIACYAGYVVQAIVNLFPPLLFVRFQEEFGVTLPQLSLLVVVNFATQLATDLLATPFILRCGYRAAMLAAQALAASWLCRPDCPEPPTRDCSPRCSSAPSAAA